MPKYFKHYVGKLTVVLSPSPASGDYSLPQDFFWNGGSLCPPDCNEWDGSIIPEDKVSGNKFKKLTDAYRNEWNHDNNQSKSILFSKESVENLLNQTDEISGGLKIYFAQYEEDSIPDQVNSSLKEHYLGKLTVVLAASNNNLDPNTPSDFMNGGSLCPPYCYDVDFKEDFNKILLPSLEEV